ncbi:MAG: rhamnan synthesis F family protein, partial [Campylobacterota bacterium]|nr:rhamnan synthesis F family protein [Campylobacterota bacterium]
TEKKEYEEELAKGFDVEFYKNSYDDLKAIESDEFDFLLQFIRYGKREKRVAKYIKVEKKIETKTEIIIELENSQNEPLEVEITEYIGEELTIHKTGLFDAEYYLSVYTDIASSGADPLKHFCQYGWKEDRVPNVWFDTKFYLDSYGDIKESGMNPFLHYVESGIREGRKSNPFVSHKDMLTLLSNNSFDKEYYLNQYEDVRNSGINPLFHYLASGYLEHRNPSATFDTFYYMQKHQIDYCPLLHFIEHPDNKTLPKSAVYFEGNKEFTTTKKIAIQIHMFYTDIAPQIKKYLLNMPFNFDLLISTMSNPDKIYIENFFADTPNLKNLHVEVVENIGRDITPMFITFKDAWYKYDYMCHIHTKRSLHTDWGDMWRTYLFDKLLGDSNIIRESIEYFETHEKCAILYPENYFTIKRYIHSDDNLKQINTLVERLNLPIEESYSHYEFAAGTMQWFKTECFRELIGCNFEYEDFQNTNTNLDGTLAHAMERFFSIYAQKSEYEVSAYYNHLYKHKHLFTEASQYSDNYTVGNKWMRNEPKISANTQNKLSPMYNYFDKKSLNIHWVIPDFMIGAGGHMTIFRMVYFLEKLGHRQTIWIQTPEVNKTPSIAKTTINQHFQPIGDNVDVHFLPDNTEWISGDIVFATDCWTTYPVRSMSKFKKRCYFIQDYEPMFHPMGENYLIAEQTYSFGFTAVTAGTWLKKKAQDHGMTAYDFPLCADADVYSVDKSDKYIVKDKINIAFYSRSYTPRRAVKLGFAGLSELAKEESNIHVHCFGQEDLPVVPDFDYTNHGIMSPEGLAELYNSCDIGVVFSATNYSLIPLEMMACGLPIVEMDVESTRYIFDETEVTFAKPNVSSIASSIKSLIDDKSKRESQIAEGLNFLSKISWKKAAQSINDALYKELEKENYIGLDIESITNSGFSSNTHATVVIPTLNAEGEIEQLLQTLLSQKTTFSYDVIVIDSESDDTTAQILQEYSNRYENINYIGIKRKDFQHGRTRDMGIEKAQGDYVAFLTQDALPYDENWLEELIKGFSVDEKIVGVFGKHVAYEEHSAFVKRDMNNHFNHFDTLPKVYSWSDSMPSHIARGSLEWQMKMMFYSDNNSAISKKAWKSIPYPHIGWGEDQVWAW